MFAHVVFIVSIVDIVAIVDIVSKGHGQESRVESQEPRVEGLGLIAVSGHWLMLQLHNAG